MEFTKSIYLNIFITTFENALLAIHRSKLWQSLSEEVLNKVPSAGTILAALTDSSIDQETYDRELPERHRSTLY
jgi:uncharacterized protein